MLLFKLHLLAYLLLNACNAKFWQMIRLSYFCEFIAPEVLKNKGYNRSLDMWSVGVIIYVRYVICLPI